MNNATVTYASLPQNVMVGSWIKVTADDNLPGDHVDPGDAGQTTKLGQAAKVIAINGNTVTLEGALVRAEPLCDECPRHGLCRGKIYDQERYDRWGGRRI